MKIGFFGTPEHSAKLLKAMFETEHEISFVVTNIDKPFGRDKILTSSPVKKFALEKNIPVLQFTSIKTDEAIDKILNFEADIFIVFAYGHIIPRKIFDSPKLGTINLHGSLLPEYRGASPVQQALLEGKNISGITLQYITEELDAGDILLKKEVDIEKDDNSETLLSKLTSIGIESVLKVLNSNKKWEAKPQDSTKASFCKKIKSDDRKLDFNLSSKEIFNKINALFPNYTSYCFLNKTRLNIIKAKLDESEFQTEKIEVGSIHFFNKKSIGIQCGDGRFLILETIQPENKKVMQIADFLNGSKPKEGEKFS